MRIQKKTVDKEEQRCVVAAIDLKPCKKLKKSYFNDIHIIQIIMFKI